MRFLADECCPRPIIIALRRGGHDVISIAEQSKGASDPDVASIAFADDRVLITEDYGFGELAVRHGVEFHGLIILAMTDQPEQIRVDRVLQVTARMGEGLRGQLVIVDPRRERVRPLAAD